MMKKADLTQGTGWKLILAMAVPTMFGYLFNQLYSIVDGIIVGQALGVNALAAVGSTGSLLNLFCSLVIGSTIAAGVLAGQYFGSGNVKKTALAIANAAYFNVFLAVILTVLAVIFARPLLILFRTGTEILEDAAVYLQIYSCGIFFMTLFYGSFAILRAFGDAKTPLYFMIISSVSNIVMDLAFIYLLHWGVFGAALATTLSQGFAGLLCLLYSIRTNPCFALALREHAFDRVLFLDCAKIGMSLGIQSALIYLSTSIMQAIINGYGSDTIAAFTITAKLEQLILQPIMAWANGMTAFVSQNIGAGKPERVRSAMHSTLIVLGIFSLLMLGLFAVCGRLLCRMFVSDATVIAMAASGILMEGVFIFSNGVSQVTRNILTGAGDTVFPIWCGAAEILARVSLCFLLTSIPFIGVWGIWLTTGLTWTVTALYAYAVYRRGGWVSQSKVRS